MSAPNPSMLIFPREQIDGGYREVRIMRLSPYAITAFNNAYGFTFIGGVPVPTGVILNPYLWETFFPADVAHLDDQNNSDIIAKVGPINYSYKDELARIRVATRNVEFNDKEGFSGVDGLGNVIPWQPLFAEGKTLVTHYFNDKSDATNFILWTTVYDRAVGGNVIKVSFMGDIDKNNMPDQPVIIRNEDNSSNLLRIPTITLRCVPCYDRMLKYKMRDLIWNHWQDGNAPIAQSDTDGYAVHPARKSFWAGFRAKTDETHISDFVFASGFDPTGNNSNIPDSYNVSPAITYPAGKGAQEWVSIQALHSDDTYPVHTAVFNYYAAGQLNLYGLLSSSFRNGWYGISLRKILEKIAQWSGCDPTNLVTADQTIIGGSAEFNNTTGGYDCFAKAAALEPVAVWNLLFGVDPRGMQIDNTSCTPGSTIKVAFVAPFSDPSASKLIVDLVDGMEVLIDGADDPAANGIRPIANVDTKINAGTINNPGPHWEVNFDLVGSIGTKAVGGGLGSINTLFSTPITYDANTTFLDGIKDVLYQFHYKLKFPITQSGSTMGMPSMSLVSRWKPGIGKPDHWKQGTKFSRQPRKIASDCIKVSQRGDSGFVVCPSNGKLPPLEIQPLRWRTHQWGTSNGIFPPNLVFDASTGKNLFTQTDVVYNDSDVPDPQGPDGKTGKNLFLTGNGWLMGAYLYEPYNDAAANSHYPAVWATNNWANVNGPFANGNWRGNYMLQALVWSGGSYSRGAALNLLPNQFDAKFDIARLCALEFVGNKEVMVRDFLNVLLTDDPDAEYEASWQEGGVQVTSRMTDREYDEEIGAFVSTTWEVSPTDYTDLSKAPQCAFFGGANQGTTSTGGAGSTTSNNTTNIVNNNNNFNDTYRVRTRQVQLYSGGVIKKTFAKVMIFEALDTVNNRWVAQYGFLPEYEPQTYDNYGFNSFVLFHYKGQTSGGLSEFGNTYIDGLSPSGIPDYWFTALTQVKQGPDNTSLTYRLQGKTWSEDKNDWLLQRFLEHANPNRRIHVAGRFTATRALGAFTNLTWVDLTDANIPFSNDECKSDADLGIIGAGRTAPNLVGNANSIDITWNSRLKPVSIMAQAWGIYNTNKMAWQIGANPVINQKVNSHTASINFWFNDYAQAVPLPGAVHTNIATAGDLDTYIVQKFIIDFWGELEIIGENATVS